MNLHQGHIKFLHIGNFPYSPTVRLLIPPYFRLWWSVSIRPLFTLQIPLETRQLTSQRFVRRSCVKSCSICQDTVPCPAHHLGRHVAHYDFEGTARIRIRTLCRTHGLGLRRRYRSFHWWIHLGQLFSQFWIHLGRISIQRRLWRAAIYAQHFEALPVRFLQFWVWKEKMNCSTFF